MDEFERRVENWFVDVMCMVLDIFAVMSSAILSIFGNLEVGLHAWNNCGEECFLTAIRN